MKVLLIVLGVVLVLAGAVQILSMRSQKNIESDVEDLPDPNDSGIDLPIM